MIPQTIARYKIKSELGRGGMAVVYLAHDPNIDREVALKLLPREFSNNPDFLSRFQREARTIGKLENPAVVPIYDTGEANGQPFLVMRLMQGGSLQDRLKRGALSLREATDLFNHLAPALDEAHAKGIIHRDLKPGNILLDGQGNPYLSDFGIVKLMEATSLTTRGAIGTPAFMSPEHYEGKISPQSDIYAMGVILFHMLTGQYPFRAKTPPEWLKAHLMQPVPNICHVLPDLPPALTSIIETAMAKEATDRYGSVGEMARMLKEAGRTVFGEEPTVVEVQEGPLWLTDSADGRYELKQGSLTLGRSSRCDIQVNDRLASREHVTLEFDGQSCTAYDEGSANGTFINEQRVGQRGMAFWLGDTLRIGEMRFKLRRETQGVERDEPYAGRTAIQVDTRAETDYRETVMETELSSQQKIDSLLTGKETEIEEAEVARVVRPAIPKSPEKVQTSPPDDIRKHPPRSKPDGAKQLWISHPMTKDKQTDVPVDSAKSSTKPVRNLQASSQKQGIWVVGFFFLISTIVSYYYVNPTKFPTCYVSSISMAECEVLIKLSNSTDGRVFNGLSLCNSPGVGCNYGHVTFLNLSGDLSGSIPPELSKLTNLEHLNLDGNDLSGSIPPELSKLTNLEHLNLDGNDLSGSIPPELSKLTNLRYLYLDDNDLSGSIPPELSKLTNLERLYLNGNQLNGSIPPELSKLTNLERLYLNGNQLSGSIPPKLSKLTNLEHLYLNGNQLSGSIPPELSKLTNLEHLYLDDNDLSGSIPSELSQLNLNSFHFDLCAPSDASFQEWLDGIKNLDRTNVLCE
ncbi:leucine-rich repeat domain-containing protein [Anaerolineales bacterium HSG24]|nr:leucine-rich repeat domain-containing protein [Anaerolineales bacterium HSG24]